MTVDKLDSQIIFRFVEILQEVSRQTQSDFDLLTLNVHIRLEFDSKILAVSRAGKSYDWRLLPTKFLPSVPLVRIDITFLNLDNLYSSYITSHFVCKARRVLSILNPEDKLRIYDQHILLSPSPELDTDPSESEVVSETGTASETKDKSDIGDNEDVEPDGQIGSLRQFDHIGNFHVKKEDEVEKEVEGEKEVEQSESLPQPSEEVVVIIDNDEKNPDHSLSDVSLESSLSTESVLETLPLNVSNTFTLADAISQFVDAVEPDLLEEILSEIQ